MDYRSTTNLTSHNASKADANQITQDLRPLDTFDFDNDLLFTYTHFCDLELGQDEDLWLANCGDIGGETILSESGDIPPLDFSPQGNFEFPHLNKLFQDDVSQMPTPAQIDPSVCSEPCFSGSTPASTYTHSASKPQKAPSSSQTGVSRNKDRLAAEEDKRLRNTLASARFRLKKKQNEQALQKSAKELRDKLPALQNRVRQLEMENEWVKSLIIKKNGSEEDIAALLEKRGHVANEESSNKKR